MTWQSPTCCHHARILSDASESRVLEKQKHAKCSVTKQFTCSEALSLTNYYPQNIVQCVLQTYLNCPSFYLEKHCGRRHYIVESWCHEKIIYPSPRFKDHSPEGKNQQCKLCYVLQSLSVEWQCFQQMTISTDNIFFCAHQVLHEKLKANKLRANLQELFWKVGGQADIHWARFEGADHPCR